jgi:hypothetical protein
MNDQLSIAYCIFGFFISLFIIAKLHNEITLASIVVALLGCLIWPMYVFAMFMMHGDRIVVWRNRHK